MAHRASRLVVTLLLSFSSLAPLLAVEAPTKAPAEVLARWRGGELSRERFETLYDPEGKALARGGKVLRTEICKATFREIYERRALAEGLERDPAVLSEIARWREDALARRYEASHYVSPVTDEVVRARYERDLASEYTSPPSVSLDVLFVRCGLTTEDRRACRARMDDLSRRLDAGEAFTTVSADEKLRSGGANGHFDLVPTTRLDPTLGPVAESAAPGQISPVVESLFGLYRLRVTDRKAAAAIPFATVRPAVQHRAEDEAIATWREAELARLRQRLATQLSPQAQADTVLAAGAVAEGIDRDPKFLASAADRKSWILADAAFLRHREIQPTDAQLAAQLDTQSIRFRRFHLLLGTLPVRQDLERSLKEAAVVTSALRAARHPGERLEALAQELPGLEIEAVGPAKLEELRARSPRLADLVAPLATDAWAGPEAMGWRRLPAVRLSAVDDAKPEPSLLFVVVIEARLPALDEVREELLHDQRAGLGNGVDAFLAVMKPAWGVELLVD